MSVAPFIPTYAQWYFPATTVFGNQTVYGGELFATNGGGSDYFIDWGDGDGTPIQYHPNNSNGVDLNATHYYVDDGTYTVRVRAPDHGTALLRATIDTDGSASSVSGAAAIPNLVITAGLTTVATGSDRDLVYALAGGDISTGGGDDAIYLQSGVTFASVHAGAGSDIVYAGSTTVGIRYDMGDGADDVFAGSGNDTIFGGAGDDFVLDGGAGNDIIQGGDGNDGIRGGTGADRLTGGAGFDVFRYWEGDSTLGANRDTILDFNVNEDMLQIYLGGNGNFVGTGNFTGNAGDFRYVNSGAFTIVKGDLDGNKVADMEIILRGTLTLTADNFSFPSPS